MSDSEYSARLSVTDHDVFFHHVRERMELPTPRKPGKRGFAKEQSPRNASTPKKIFLPAE
jgi:hypothetical protein